MAKTIQSRPSIRNWQWTDQDRLVQPALQLIQTTQLVEHHLLDPWPNNYTRWMSWTSNSLPMLKSLEKTYRQRKGWEGCLSSPIYITPQNIYDHSSEHINIPFPYYNNNQAIHITSFLLPYTNIDCYTPTLGKIHTNSTNHCLLYWYDINVWSIFTPQNNPIKAHREDALGPLASCGEGFCRRNNH